ncbi:hypothetical protein Golax_000524 [Gossypium laxum]|uniref:V-type proton ATPase subunit F n=3 Tax=Gossypium TaxID=3633 RepID=A0A7J9KA68_9ROSI|nr:hypothetical protein [Gossypium laxum]MBA0843246.1 hypothetical protein [Gossypium armourianum]
MANTAHIPTSNSALIAMIADEDTVVGFLLAGVGNVDLRRKTNYLIVDSRRFLIYLKSLALPIVIIFIFHLWMPFVFYLLETTDKQIEDAFKEFTTRTDIAIVLISQYVSCLLNVLSYRIIYFLMIVKVANMIRFLVDSYNKPIPAILEIPSKNHPYDPAHDSILSRVKHLFNAESVASTRH